MKKLFYTLGAALVMLASVSCEKKETVKEVQSSEEKVDMTFKAVPAGTARTTVQSDGTTVIWSSTDDIKVYSAGATSGVICPMSKGAGTTYAEFTGQCSGVGPWSVICPSSVAKGFSSGKISFTVPAAQTYAENTFAAGAMPCVAYSSTTELSFNHVFGVLKLQLKGEGSVKSIMVTTKGSEKLNGTFTVTPSSSAVAKYSTGGSSSVTLNCNGVELSTSTATEFWIVVPQGAFASGFDVEITATDDKVATLSTDKNNSITAGEIKPMPEMLVEFNEPEPTTGYAEVKSEAGVPENKVKWVQLWENGPKFAEFNVGATSISEVGGHYCWGSDIDQDPNQAFYDGDGNIQGTDHDTAKNLWGNNWQMPTKADYDALIKKCKVDWKSKDKSGYGVAGILFTGKDDYSANSVFFPTTGYYHVGVIKSDQTGQYWSDHYYTEDFAKTLYFISYGSALYYVGEDHKYYGMSVRAVLAE